MITEQIHIINRLGLHARAASDKGVGYKIKCPPQLVGQRKIMAAVFFFKSFLVKYLHDFFCKRDFDRGVLCFDLVFDQLVKIIPEFVKNIKKKNIRNSNIP